MHLVLSILSIAFWFLDPFLHDNVSVSTAKAKGTDSCNAGLLFPEE